MKKRTKKYIKAIDNEQYGRLRQSMRLWDKKLYRLNDELLTYIMQKSHHILELRAQQRKEIYE